MTLYEIDQKIHDLIDDETGEVLDYDAFFALDMARDEKIENTLLFIKSLRAEAAAIDAEITTLAERRRVTEKHAERLEGHIELALAGEKFSTPRVTVSYRTYPAYDVTDYGALMRWAQENARDDLLRVKPPEISKSAVNAAIKGGQDIPHTQAVTRTSMKIK